MFNYTIPFSKYRINSKKVILIFLIYAFCLLLLILSMSLPLGIFGNALHNCYKESTNLKTKPQKNFKLEKLQDILDAEPQPIPNRNIFFVESSCGKRNKRKWARLNMQQACAVESAALHHNQSQVFVLFVCPSYKPKDSSYMHGLKTYKNVHSYNLNIWRFLPETPVVDLLKNNNFYNANSVHRHVSALLRLLTLWRWGGVYMDFNTLTLRNLDNLPANTVAWETMGTIGSCVLKFSANGTGHELLEQALNNFLKLLETEQIRVDAGEMLTDLLKSRCPSNFSVDSNQQCNGVLIMQKHAFYEIPFYDWHEIFIKSYMQQLVIRLKMSYVLTTWDHGKRESWDDSYIWLNSSSTFDILAAKNCPEVYKTAYREFQMSEI